MLQSEVDGNQITLNGLRKDVTAITKTENQAKTAKDHKSNEADDLRESLQQQKPDSGRVVAYQEVINVWTLMTRLIE
jgi:replication initiation and membrane attachment protein DnaB